MNEESRGSGVTFVTIITQLTAQSTAGYRTQLDAMGSGFKKKQKEDLVAGFQDGMRAMRGHLVEMGVIVILPGDES